MGKHAGLTYQPRLMAETDAAAYLGISASKLKTIGIPRRILEGRKLFDRLDLDAYASSLPMEGGGNSCDEVFR